MLTRLTVEAQARMSSFPTSVDPVKLSFRISGLPVSTAPIREDLPVSTEKSPAGIPARSAKSAKARAEKGVREAGLTRIAQPAARAGATLRVTIAEGKFHGVIAAHRPTGCFSTRSRWPK